MRFNPFISETIFSKKIYIYTFALKPFLFPFSFYPCKKSNPGKSNTNLCISFNLMQLVRNHRISLVSLIRIMLFKSEYEKKMFVLCTSGARRCYAALSFFCGFILFLGLEEYPPSLVFKVESIKSLLNLRMEEVDTTYVECIINLSSYRIKV